MNRLAPAALLLALLGACATPPPPPAPTERVVLLPNADGRASAVIVTRRDGQSVRLEQPYAAAQVSRVAVATQTSSAAEVQGNYGLLMSVQPPMVKLYTLYFEYNRTVLTADSQREVDRILAEAAVAPAAEIEVIGHTDARGSQEYNDALGRSRAQVVASLMEQRGFARNRLQVQSRGEREPLVPTRSEAEEPRNRRVEIRLR
ncbi:MAG: OmpA family protein [Comamonadaceae bacterium]|nr:MAG: OmpA family protein [Comamonadaceae bacterium]